MSWASGSLALAAPGRLSGADECPDSDVVRQARRWDVTAGRLDAAADAASRSSEARVEAWLWRALAFTIWVAVLISAFGFAVACQHVVVELIGD